MRRQVAQAAVIAAISVVVASAQPSPPALWGSLEPGPFDVGYQMLMRYDPSRPPVPNDLGAVPAGATGRQMPVSVWYPARATAVMHRLRVRDYAARRAQELDLAPLDERRRAQGVAAFLSDLAAGHFSAGDAQHLLDMNLAAVDHAPAASGSFPLVVFAHSTPVAESIMAEYLASHGFVVAGVPPKGTRDAAYRLSAANFETMAADLGYVIAVARTLPFTDRTRVGIVGMSNGSNGAVELAMRDAEIAAIVSLDGTIGEGPAGYLTSTTPYYGPANLTAPLLHLYAPENPFLDFAWIRSWRYADRTLVRLPGVQHSHFLAYAAFARFLPETGHAPAPDASRDFEEVCRRTLHFLVEHLGKASAVARTTPDPLPADHQLATEIEHLPALERPPSERELNAMIERSGVGTATDLLRQRMVTDPQPLPLATFLAVHNSLMSAGQPNSALPFAKLFTEAYPASSRAHLSLAAALSAAGDTTAARAEFARVLTLVSADTLDPYTRRRVETAAHVGLGPQVKSP